ncbi:MAG: MarR family transcriptional regulator [Desulfocapsaceae bacterium]
MVDRIKQEQAIIQQMRILFKAVQAHSKKVEKACGLSSSKLWMIHEIATTPGIKVSQLAKTLSIHPSTCSNMLDKVEKAGFIYRDRSKSDQRAVHLFVTERGKEILLKAPSPPQGQLNSTLQKLNQAQLAALEKSLDEFIEVLHFEDNEAGLTPI